MRVVTGGEPVGVALIGSGRMGSFHGETLARRIPGARLVAVADPAPGAAERLAAALGGRPRVHRPGGGARRPGGRGGGDRCPGPVPRRPGRGRGGRRQGDWAAARALLEEGRLGTPRLLRSVTRDPGGFDPSRVPPGTIFNETLIHDFDTLRFLNPGAEPVQVHATADALVETGWRDRGLLDTAVVVVRFDNGAIGIAEACFEAAYGYDVRGEVLGSRGMATMGDGRRTGMVFSGAAGRSVETVRSDQELLASAYVAELATFTDVVRAGAPVPAGGEDARAALAIALAAAESVRAGRPVRIDEAAT